MAIKINEYIHERLQLLSPEYADSYKQKRQFPDCINQLATVCQARGVTARTIRTVLENVRDHIQTEEHLKEVVHALCRNPNNILVLHQTPPSIIAQVQPGQLVKKIDRVALQALAWRIGLQGDDEQKWVATHPAWLAHAGEAKRLLASGDYLENPKVKEILRHSFAERHRTYYNALPENHQVAEELRQLGIPYKKWADGQFRRRYSISQSKIEQTDEVAAMEIHKRLYSIINSLLASPTSFDRNKLLKPLMSTFEVSEAKEVFDRIVAGHATFEKEDDDGAKDQYMFELSHMNNYLLNLIGGIQTHQEKRENKRRLPDARLARALDELVALQRVISPHDERISLSRQEARPPAPVSYVIEKSDKDPIHFLTEGNDSGVCDSTTDRQAHKAPLTAKNQAIQFSDVLRISVKHGRERKKRVGQIRFYAGTEDGKPVLLVNSIDLEAEERTNLELYRAALDYSKDFMAEHGFKKLLLGKHGDTHIRPFDNLDLFSDLKPRKARLKLLHTFPKDHAFSDFFGEYEQTQGEADVYEIAT